MVPLRFLFSSWITQQARGERAERQIKKKTEKTKETKERERERERKIISKENKID